MEIDGKVIFNTDFRKICFEDGKRMKLIQDGAVW
jgi:hypothetical protein